ncbi:hypothetical protein M231_05556 [Tremella mesenterica]|uniref:Peptidase A1 domain-containing protein n=1 Tax=Tremella mesenterica TaxID=5217 RepID=A0A4V1M3K5_TREME|nr:uncharacterized protein TREMEDRAFT_63867 [Tremella mesenterica DSM 1558]EIW67983.1 hypothetical protein TREMEDRAFT_63867 [Tremella mesenterica DSM 1558]RXK37187.1 hypothetical protein M231_05556 [Tremella mesenterica]
MFTIIMLVTTFITISSVMGQISMPVLSDPAFHTAPAEEVLQRQLASWGVKLGLTATIDTRPLIDTITSTSGNRDAWQREVGLEKRELRSRKKSKSEKEKEKEKEEKKEKAKEKAEEKAKQKEEQKEKEKEQAEEQEKEVETAPKKMGSPFGGSHGFGSPGGKAWKRNAETVRKREMARHLERKEKDKQPVSVRSPPLPPYRWTDRPLGVPGFPRYPGAAAWKKNEDMEERDMVTDLWEKESQHDDDYQLDRQSDKIKFPRWGGGKGFGGYGAGRPIPWKRNRGVERDNLVGGSQHSLNTQDRSDTDENEDEGMVESLLKATGLDMGISVGGSGWGAAEAVAKGDAGDTEWYTYISIGTPPQSLPVLPDTGSSDLFLFGPTCYTCSPQNHTIFDPSQSSTFINDSYTWDFGYADGSGVFGYTAFDQLSLGTETSSSFPSISLGSTEINTEIGTILNSNLTFAIAEFVSGNGFSKTVKSGIMGLGQDGLSTIPISSNESGGRTLFSRLVKNNQLPESVLGIRLVKGKSNQGVVLHEGSGSYVFGGIEDGYIIGGRNGLTWTSVTSLNYWGITLDDISTGTNSVLVNDNITPRRAIIDTGTTLIITSTQVATTIHGDIGGSFQDDKSGIWYVPCTVSYPSEQNVFFTIAGRRFGVPIEDIAWKVSSTYDGQCISGIQGGMSSFTVLGDMFIKNHYLVLSYGSERMDNISVGLGDRTDLMDIL